MLVFVASKIQAIQPEIYILVAHVWSKVLPVDNGSIISVQLGKALDFKKILVPSSSKIGLSVVLRVRRAGNELDIKSLVLNNR